MVEKYKKTIKLCKENLNKVFGIYIEFTKSLFSWDRLINYQNLLAETLYEEKKQEIPLKKTLRKIRNGSDKTNNEADIVKKIEELQYIEKDVIILGDFLCWILYHNNEELVEKNIDRPKTGINSIGSGIVAEIETIKRLNVPQNPYFYLYNGISSFLRVGDLSVFDKNTGKIIGFGEVKSGIPDDGIMNVSVHFVANTPTMFIPGDLTYNEDNSTEILTENMIEHLNKQVETMKDAITKKKKYDKKLEEEVRVPHYKDLEKLINKCYRNGYSIIKVSDDIVYLSIKNNNNDISFRKTVIEEVAKILNKQPKIGQNQLSIGEMDLYSNGKTIPTLAFPISNHAKRKLLNQTILIIYNCNSIIDYYDSKGFKVTIKRKKEYLEKNFEKERISICMDLLRELYMEMFLDEKSAIQIIDNMITNSMDGSITGTRHIYKDIKFKYLDD